MIFFTIVRAKHGVVWTKKRFQGPPIMRPEQPYVPLTVVRVLIPKLTVFVCLSAGYLGHDFLHYCMGER
jgi:hypothetical protein